MAQTLGKYQLGALLGQGGMGAVYRSFHPLLNRPVAIKMMLASVAADPQAQQRFLREAQIVAVLSHPHIVNIFDVDVQDGQPYIVMDYVEGGSLATRLSRQGALPLAEALQLAIPLAEALAYAHAQGLIHRDLKPANVLLHSDGRPVLADFGLARQQLADSAAQLTTSGALLGTLAYMAPEQFSGRSIDARADIYAFGVMLFEMLTGRVPFEGDSAQVMHGHLQEQPPAPRLLNPLLPEAFEQLILRTLAKDPDARPQSAAELAAELRTLQSGAAATGPTLALPMAELRLAPQSSDWPARDEPRPLLRYALLSFGAVLAIGALAWLLLGRSEPNDFPPAPPTIAARPTSAALIEERDPTPAGATAPPSATAAPLRQVAEAVLSKPQQVGPEPFSVGGLSYRQVQGSLWFFGELRNDGGEARERIELRINLLDADGKEIGSKSGFASRNYLKPGEISPFSVLFSKDDQPPAFARFAIEVRSSKADFQLGYTYRELSILDGAQARRDRYGFVKISGRVQNVGEKPSRFVQIFAVFYDASGKVVGLANSFAESSGDQPLATGADARFDLQGIIFSGEPESYRLFAEGSRSES